MLQCGFAYSDAAAQIPAMHWGGRASCGTLIERTARLSSSDVRRILNFHLKARAVAGYHLRSRRT